MQNTLNVLISGNCKHALFSITYDKILGPPLKGEVKGAC